MTGQTPPDWYPDPYGNPGLQRWWDGGQWTQATRPNAVEEAATPGFSTPGLDSPPAWNQSPGWAPPQGPQTPQPGWNAPQQQGWGATVPQQGPGRSSGMMWGLFGGGAIVVAGIVVAALFLTGVIGGSSPSKGKTVGGRTPTPQSSSPAPTPTLSVGGTGVSPVVGRISDTTAGLSYDQLGGTWLSVSPSQLAKSYVAIGFHEGEYAIVQKNFDGKGGSYAADATSGTLAPTIQYTGQTDLAADSVAEFNVLAPLAYSSHTQQVVDSHSLSSKSGKHGWLYKVKLTFPQAASSGWNWRTETAVVILVDRGSARPGMLYISVPDSFADQGDLDVLVNSVDAL